MYTVTVSGGETWHSWDAAANLHGKAFSNPGLIEDVSVNQDGTGTMPLNSMATANHERLALQTENFGQQRKTP